MWYVIDARDGENVLARRLEARPRHLERLHALRDAGRLLLLRGDEQHRHFEAAMTGEEPLASSLAAVRLAGGTPVHVHWCP